MTLERSGGTFVDRTTTTRPRVRTRRCSRPRCGRATADRRRLGHRVRRHRAGHDDHTQTAAALPGLTTFADIAVDHRHRRVFLTSGTGHDTVLVTDLDGNLVTTLTGLPGATGMAVGCQDSSVWIALADARQIVELDPVKLSVMRRIQLPPEQCPGDLAVNYRYVVYGYSCEGYAGGTTPGGVGRFEHVPTVPPTPVVTTQGPTERPVVDLSTEYSWLAVAGESGPGTADRPAATYTLDVANGTPSSWPAPSPLPIYRTSPLPRSSRPW